MSGSMLVIGSLYASGSVHAGGAGSWAVIVLYYIFVLTYESTWGIAARIYASEIQPVETRAMANCVAQGLGFVSKPARAHTCGLLILISSNGESADFYGTALVHRLACRLHNSNLTSEVNLCGLFSVRRLIIVDFDCPHHSYARDSRKVTRDN